MTIGDVLATLGAIVGFGACAWAISLGAALLFPTRCATARDHVRESAARTFGVGLALVASLGLFGLVLIGQAFPAAKLLGWIIELTLLTFASLGSGGLVMLVSERIRQLDASVTPYQALSRASTVVFLAALTPALGWFLFAPVILMVALGCGVRSLSLRRPVSQMG